MRNGLYFILTDMDPILRQSCFPYGDNHPVDLARIAELYRDIAAEDQDYPWEFYEVLSFFNLLGPDVRDEDVAHGDPAAIPDDWVEWSNIWLTLLNWTEAHFPESFWYWETVNGDAGYYEVYGAYVSGDSMDDQAVLIYDHGEICIVSTLDPAE